MTARQLRARASGGAVPGRAVHRGDGHGLRRADPAADRRQPPPAAGAPGLYRRGGGELGPLPAGKLGRDLQDGLRPSFHGDGERYHVLQYAVGSSIESALSWQAPPVDTATAEAMEALMDDLDVPDRLRPDLDRVLLVHRRGPLGQPQSPVPAV